MASEIIDFGYKIDWHLNVRVVPKGTMNKIRNHIRLIYSNKKLGADIASLEEEMKLPANFFPRDIEPIERAIAEADGVYALYGYLIGRYAEKFGKKKADDLFSTIAWHAYDANQICIKNNIDPIWSEVVESKIIGMPQSLLEKYPNIFLYSYLPQARIIDKRIHIAINKLTTIEEIKLIWPKLKMYTKDNTSDKNFHSKKRDHSQFERNKRAVELRDSGLSYSEIHKKLLSEGFDSPSYDYVSKMIKGYKNAIGEK